MVNIKLPRLAVGLSLVLLLLFGVVTLAIFPPWKFLDDGLKKFGVSAFPGRIAPKAPPLPSVGLPGAIADEKVLLSVPPETAKEINDAIPFAKIKIAPARPFASALTGLDRERAIMCLTIAGIYEAGGAEVDQRPVMQVILNRVRHPAFPSSVCGVVFQGSERRTGCQFSFTCDGSMTRWRPAPATLARTKKLAEVMLSSGIDSRVGLSTHYHTDWVVPYWSSSLDKVAAVKTHLFFVWKGYWGQANAFKTKPARVESSVPKMASFSAAHLSGLTPEEQIAAEAMDDLAIVALDAEGVLSIEPPVEVKPVVPKIQVFRIEVASTALPGRLALDALKTCGVLPECRVVGWQSASSPQGDLTYEGLAASPPDFVFVQELRNRVQMPYWDCAKWPKASTSRCLSSGPDTARLATGG